MSLTLAITVTSVGTIVGLFVGQKQKISFTYKNIHCVKGLDNLYYLSISNVCFIFSTILTQHVHFLLQNLLN